MISFREQLVWIIYYLLFGYFLAAMSDILHFYLNKTRLNLILKYIFQLFFWCGLAYLATIYIMKLSNGALNVYTFGFFVIGALIHYFYFSKKFIKNLDMVSNACTKLYQKTKKTLIIIVFPREVLSFIKKVLPQKAFFKKVYKKFFSRKHKTLSDEKEEDQI